MKKRECVGYRYFDAKNVFTFEEIKDVFELMKEGDELEFVIDREGYYSENNSWDPYTRLSIYRYREETEEERQIREERERMSKEESKQRRRERYLELKKEFGDEE